MPNLHFSIVLFLNRQIKDTEERAQEARAPPLRLFCSLASFCFVNAKLQTLESGPRRAGHRLPPLPCSGRGKPGKPRPAPPVPGEQEAEASGPSAARTGRPRRLRQRRSQARRAAEVSGSAVHCRRPLLEISPVLAERTQVPAGCEQVLRPDSHPCSPEQTDATQAARIWEKEPRTVCTGSIPPSPRLPASPPSGPGTHTLSG